MNSFLDYILAHPFILIVTGIILVALILIYLLKNFAKIVLVSVLIILAGLVGYHYFQAEGKFNERMKSALLETKEQIGQYIEKGKGALFRGKKIIVPDEETDGKSVPKRNSSKMEPV